MKQKNKMEDFLECYQAKKKFSLVSGNRMDEKFLSLTRRHIRMCIRTYIKLKRKISKKPQQNNTTQKQKKLKKKR